MPQGDGMPGSDVGGQPDQTAGTQPGQAGSPGSDNRGQAGQADNTLPSYGEAGTGNGGLIYGGEDDPFGTIGSNTTGAGNRDSRAGTEADGSGAGGAAGRSDTARGGAAAGSTQARIGELDARLEESYGEFDGMILSERERAQGMGENEQSAQTRESYGGGGSMPGDEGAAGAGGSGDRGPIIARNSSSNAGGGYMPNSSNREGEFDNSSQGEQHPVPQDIPAGNNDDVVARQLREAAMSEPDPEVRERLWNEYRRYTGLPVSEGDE